MELRDKFRIFPYWNSPQPPVQKEYVRSLFDSIASRYDLLNHLLSGGVDLYWRHRAIEHLRSLTPSRVLDVATGTGDFAIAALAVEPNKVVGVDIAEKMLNHGREKVRRRGMEGRITLQSGDAEHLEFDSGTFDAAIVAFGARNFEDLHSGLREMHRILRKGGRVVVLEFSRPRHFPFKQLYFFYFLRILPFIGRRISNHHAAYTYLPESVLRFPEGDEFLDVLRSVGFTNLTQERLTFGIATVYTGDT